LVMHIFQTKNLTLYVRILTSNSDLLSLKSRQAYVSSSVSKIWLRMESRCWIFFFNIVFSSRSISISFCSISIWIETFPSVNVDFATSVLFSSNYHHYLLLISITCSNSSSAIEILKQTILYCGYHSKQRIFILDNIQCSAD